MRTALLLLAVVGCAHAPARTDPRPPPADDDPRAGPLAEGQGSAAKRASMTPASAPVAAPAPEDASEIPRQALLGVLDKGPPLFLQGLRVRAVLVGDAFQGWEILDLRDGRLASAGLRPHDVVTAVNGRTIEQPDQLGEVWDALRTAPELTVDFLRDGQPRHLRFAIRE